MIKSVKVNQNVNSLEPVKGCDACKSKPIEINIITICKERGKEIIIALCDHCYTKL